MSSVETDGCLLVVAAEVMEFEGLLRRVAVSTRLPWPSEFAVRTTVKGDCWVLAANGPGSALAGEAVRTALKFCRPRALLSTGWAGGLTEDWRCGDILVSSEVVDQNSGVRFSAIPPTDAPPYNTGCVLSVNRVATTVGEKRALAAYGADAVEMEAAAVAAEAAEAKLPFHCVRVVSDTVSDELPLDFNEFRAASGRFNRRQIAAHVALHPWLAPRLLGFRRAVRRAADTLGDFLVHCHF